MSSRDLPVCSRRGAPRLPDCGPNDVCDRCGLPESARM